MQQLRGVLDHFMQNIAPHCEIHDPHRWEMLQCVIMVVTVCLSAGSCVHNNTW